MSRTIQELELWCLSGGTFYVCPGASLEFLGCCTIDPCADGSGKCPMSSMRVTSFIAGEFAQVPEQNCSDNRGPLVWYTCPSSNPTFLGCCTSDACADGGCPEDHLIPAQLSDISGDRDAFISAIVSKPIESTTPTVTNSPIPGPPRNVVFSTSAVIGTAILGTALLVSIGIMLGVRRQRAGKNAPLYVPFSQGYHPIPEVVNASSAARE